MQAFPFPTQFFFNAHTIMQRIMHLCMLWECTNAHFFKKAQLVWNFFKQPYKYGNEKGNIQIRWVKLWVADKLKPRHLSFLFASFPPWTPSPSRMLVDRRHLTLWLEREIAFWQVCKPWIICFPWRLMCESSLLHGWDAEPHCFQVILEYSKIKQEPTSHWFITYIWHGESLKCSPRHIQPCLNVRKLLLTLEGS